MNKQQFLNALRNALDGFPREEVDRSVSYYAEMIDDRMENGMSEADAVASLGSVEEVVRKIREEMPVSALVKDHVRTSYHKTKEKNDGSAVPWIILSIVLCPFWIPLVIVALALLFSLFAVMFALVISVICIFIAMIAMVIVSVFAIGAAIGTGTTAGVLFWVGCLLLGFGLAILLFWASLGLCVAVVRGIRAICRAIKRGLSRK